MISTKLRDRRTKSRKGSLRVRLGLGTLAETDFARMLCLERKRAERSGRRFVLMLLDWQSLVRLQPDPQICEKLLGILLHTTRETDVKGWHKEGASFGIIFTEVGLAEATAIVSLLRDRVRTAFEAALNPQEADKIHISFRVFPDEHIDFPDVGAPDLTLYPDEKHITKNKRWSFLFKRIADIVGSTTVMILFAPFFAVLAVAVKLSSPGPVLFRQERIGRYGQKFTFFKFRSMYVANDESLHREFTRRFISGELHEESGESPNKGFKIRNDPRVTPIGKWLRRTSLDELPQFWNVLIGDMSIVGPRPPLSYEVSQYDTWHRQRLMTVRPGITGLWQVCGRSRVKFDEMVRLDLLYVENWDLLLDLWIIALTPQAVVGGSGAY